MRYNDKSDKVTEEEIEKNPVRKQEYKPSEFVASDIDKAYITGFTSPNKGGKCEKCGKETMYKERTLCYKCYLASKQGK